MPAPPAVNPLKIAVLISGRGSNLRALLEACAQPAFPARVVLVAANVAHAPGLAHAAAAGVPTAVVDHTAFTGRDAFDAALRGRIEAAGADLVCLAGFMRILGAGFVDAFRGRLINIHPSLLPAFPGLHVHERVLAAGTRFSGCTVHFVGAETDAGPILLQAAVPVHPDDTPDALAARVLAAEHVCYPLAVRWIAEGRVYLKGENVKVDGAHPPAGVLFNPAPDRAAGTQGQPTISSSGKK